jgi:hypothetical protein
VWYLRKCCATPWVSPLDIGMMLLHCACPPTWHVAVCALLVGRVTPALLPEVTLFLWFLHALSASRIRAFTWSSDWIPFIPIITDHENRESANEYRLYVLENPPLTCGVLQPLYSSYLDQDAPSRP